MLEPPLATELAALLAFRHFFRHAYAVRLDVGRLRTELVRLFAVEAQVAQALDALEAHLRAALSALTGGGSSRLDGS